MLGLRCGTRNLSLRRMGFFLVVAYMQVFSLVVACRLQGAWAPLLWRAGSRAHGLCSLQHTGSLVEARELSSCGARA